VICDGVATRCMITRRKPSAASESLLMSSVPPHACGVWTKQAVTGPATSGSEHVPVSLVQVGVGGAGGNGARVKRRRGVNYWEGKAGRAVRR